MALPPCGRKVCEVAARIPTQVKLLFATLVYYAVICVVFWQVENWPVRQISKVRPPHKTIAVEGVDGQSTTIPVPTRAFVYYAGELAPAFCLWLAHEQ